MAARRDEWGEAIRGGVVAGLVGGVVMSVFILMMTAASGGDLWSALKGPAIRFLGERAMQPGFDGGAVALGVICHFAVAIVWGGLFGWFAYGSRRDTTIWLGMLWGIVVWFAMLYIVLPVIGLGAVTRSIPVGLAIVEHLLFGLGVGVGFQPFQRPRLPATTVPVQRPTRGGRDIESAGPPPAP